MEMSLDGKEEMGAFEVKGTAGLAREEGAGAVGRKVNSTLLQYRKEEGSFDRFSLGSHNESQEGVAVT